MQYIIKQVEEEVGYTLNEKQVARVNDMYKLGMSIRQMVGQVRDIKGYEIAMERRNRYVAALRGDNTVLGALNGAVPLKLTGSEMEKFKHHIDIQDGVASDWYKEGWCTYIAQEQEDKKETKKKQKAAQKKKDKAIKAYQKKQEKAIKKRQKDTKVFVD